MALSPDHFDQTFSPAGSPGARDRGLRRTRSLTRWIAVTAVAATAALGSVYTHLIPGSQPSPATSSPPAQSPPTPSPTTREDEEGASDHDKAAAVTRPAPQAPAQPPVSTQQKPHTTTGAS
ncbi:MULTISPECIES: hypothetical protein [unclassified Streptomyces]|uniref:hypothetical protein n=1 Tax=unclassified Streptomyces TaxID=2593676 RepID=UPI0040415CCE